MEVIRAGDQCMFGGNKVDTVAACVPDVQQTGHNHCALFVGHAHTEHIVNDMMSLTMCSVCAHVSFIFMWTCAAAF